MSPRCLRRLSSSETLTDNVQPAPVNNTGAIYQEQCKRIINYKLPPPVRDAVQGWKDACGSISIISPLSTAVVTALLQILDTDKDRAETLQIFLYISIVFNLGATTCAVLCLFMLSDFTTKARVIAATDNTSLPKECLLDDVMLYRYIEEDRERELLRNFGLGRPWSIATATMNYCFLCGTVCTFVGLGIGVWYRCINFAAGVIVTTALGLVGGASGLVLMLLISGNASDISCSAVKKRTFCSRSTWEESLEAGCRMQRKGMATAGEEGGGAALTRQD